MSFFMIKMMVLRKPGIKYVMEMFTCDSVHQTLSDVAKKLEDDKDVIDYYQIM